MHLTDQFGKIARKFEMTDQRNTTVLCNNHTTSLDYGVLHIDSFFNCLARLTEEKKNRPASHDTKYTAKLPEIITKFYLF